MLGALLLMYMDASLPAHRLLLFLPSVKVSAAKPAPVTDVVWLYLVCRILSAVVVAPSSGGIGFLLPSLVSGQPRAAVAKVHPADTTENLELVVIFCRYWAKHYSSA